MEAVTEERAGGRRSRGLRDLPAWFEPHLVASLADIGPDLAAVMVFGSYARGDAAAGSDVDICLVCDSGQAAERDDIAARARVATFWIPEKLDMGRDVLCFSKAEFERRSNIPLTIESEIARDGVVLYAR